MGAAPADEVPGDDSPAEEADDVDIVLCSLSSVDEDPEKKQTLVRGSAKRCRGPTEDRSDESVIRRTGINMDMVD